VRHESFGVGLQESRVRAGRVRAGDGAGQGGDAGGHIRGKHTDGNNEAFLVQRSGAPAEVGRLNGIVFQDFCIDGVASTKPYVEGNHKIGISV
jgi:hypothetical protein